MTAAEQAREDVEGCFAERMGLNGWPPDVVKWGLEQQRTLIDSLIARLMPMYERAQKVEAAEACMNAMSDKVKYAQMARERAFDDAHVLRARAAAVETERNALRERADRAEAAVHRLEQNWWNAASALKTVEADVARLRKAIRKHLTMADHDGLIEDDWTDLRAALAATERKP